MQIDWPIGTASALTIIAFFAHTFVGTRESLSTRPGPLDDGGQRERCWVQSQGAFQLVTVDLFAAGLLLALLAVPGLLPMRHEIAWIGAVWFAAWGVAWLLQLAALRRPAGDYLRLGQWALFWAVAALLAAGAPARA